MRFDQLVDVYSMRQSIKDLLDDVVSVLYIQAVVPRIVEVSSNRYVHFEEQLNKQKV